MGEQSRRAGMRRSGAQRWIAGLLCGLIWSVVPVAPAAAQTFPAEGLLGITETEALVRGRYYEGLPREQVARIGPEGCQRLLGMLGDPAERRHHGQVLVAVGVCAPEGALEAIDTWLAALPDGEIDRARFKAWLSVPHALAALAAHDPRALERLEERMAKPEAPRFRHGRHHGARLYRLQRDGAATGLAETGLPEARAALDRAQGLSSDGAFVNHLQSLRGLHRKQAELRVGGDAP